MQFHLHTLKNGLRVILAPMKDNRTATVIVMSGTGSRYETREENGLAHFLEHMFFKGTKRRKDARAISEELDALGSVSNAFTSKERTAYYAKVASRYAMEALDIISDIYLHSTLPSKEIQKERGAIIQKIDMYEDMTMRTIDNVFDELIYGKDHPLGRTVLGPKENIRAFTRKQFDAYLKRHYNPGNTVVCVAGNFDEKKVLAKITKDFGSIKNGEISSYAPFSDTQTEPRVLIKEKKTDQTQLMLGVPAYPYGHKDEYALGLLATVLGGGMSSRLFLEVREKRGLAYSVSAGIDKYPDTGSFYVSAGIEHGKLEKVVQTILKELKKIQKEKVSAAELKKAKAYLTGNLALHLETSDEIAENAATSLINTGKVRTLEERIKAINAVTADDIQRVARDIFRTDKLNLAVIGPHKDDGKLIDSLAL